MGCKDVGSLREGVLADKSNMPIMVSADLPIVDWDHLSGLCCVPGPSTGDSR